MGGMRWSSPAPVGHGRVGIIPEARSDDDKGSGPNPDIAVEYRRGLNDRADLGGRVHAFGLGLDSRILLARSDELDIAIGLGLRASTPRVRFDPFGAIQGFETALDPALRLGLHVSRTSQVALALTPSLGYYREKLQDTSFSKEGVLLAPSATLAFDIGVSDGFHIVPEVGVTSFVGMQSFVLTDDTVRVRAAIGFYF